MVYQSTTRKIQSTTSTTDFFVVAKMSVDLVGFVILVGHFVPLDWKLDNYKRNSDKWTRHFPTVAVPIATEDQF